MPLLRVVNTGSACGWTNRYGSPGSWPGCEAMQVPTRRASGKTSSRSRPSNNACMQPDHDTRTRVRREGQASQGRVNARGWRPPAGRCSGEAAAGAAAAAAAACRTCKPFREGAAQLRINPAWQPLPFVAPLAETTRARVAAHACREEASHPALRCTCPQAACLRVGGHTTEAGDAPPVRSASRVRRLSWPPVTEAAPWRLSSCAWRSLGALPALQAPATGRKRVHSFDRVGAPRRVCLPPGGSGSSPRSCPRLLTVSAQAAPPHGGGGCCLSLGV